MFSPPFVTGALPAKKKQKAAVKRLFCCLGFFKPSVKVKL
jgi:hypothetical protein